MREMNNHGPQNIKKRQYVKLPPLKKALTVTQAASAEDPQTAAVSRKIHLDQQRFLG